MSDSPTAAALADLRQAIADAEELLARRQAEGASLSEAFGLAGDVVVARAEAQRAQTALDPRANQRRGAEFLAEALGMADPSAD